MFKIDRWGEAVYKLVIVEDEDNIRHSLECFIPWEKIGFQVVNTFSDGSDALAYLRDNPCDAVLTDILMSRMSGLEMIRNLHETRPQIKVVILSGHSAFSYAQQAIQYQVVHYLVKPVDEDELIDVFKGIKEQLDCEQAEHTVAESDTRELKQILQKSFVRDLLSGCVASDGELSAYIKLLGMERITQDSQLIAFEIKARSPAQDQQGIDVASLEDMLRDCLSGADKEPLVFYAEERPEQWNVAFVGLPQTDSAEFRRYCNEKIRLLVGSLNEELPYEFTFRLTHSVMHITDLLTPTKNTAVTVQQMDEALCQSVVSDYKLLIVELDLGSKETLAHILNGMVQDLDGTALEDMRFIFKNLYSAIELNYKKRKVNVWNITDGKFNFSHLYRAKDAETVAACLKEDFFALCDGLASRKYHSEHNVIERIVQYLDAHLDEDIGHDALAAKYRIHPGYLSRLFKQEMGETLSEYLFRIKIERAAQLLKERRNKIGEIAGMVGYSSSSYFSVMFKKYTGYSPREYCQRISL